MPGHPVHPHFDITTYRSPRGEQNQRDQEFLNFPQNEVNYGFVSDLIIGTTHMGTHIDAFCHVVSGPNAEWFNGRSAADDLGDFGALSWDASIMPPVIGRGILLDIPRSMNLETCPANFPIDGGVLSETLTKQGLELSEGDVILIRTGLMKFWPDEEAMQQSANAGVSRDGSDWIAAQEPIAVGSDTAAFEVSPSDVPGSPQPVHVHLIKELGIPIMEWVNCEELSEAQIYEFLFVCLPLTISGATGSWIRPVAIA